MQNVNEILKAILVCKKELETCESKLELEQVYLRLMALYQCLPVEDMVNDERKVA